MDESKNAELLQLLQEIDVEKLKEVAGALLTTTKDVVKIPKEHGPVRQYTVVHMKHTCLLCGSVTNHTYELKKGDKISTIDSAGNGHTMTATGKAGEIDLASFNSRCHKCPEVIKTWTREELEQRFLLLLKNTTFKEVIDCAVDMSNKIQ